MWPGHNGGSTALGFEGLQIFDVSNKAAPRFVKAVFTDFGSHTHTQYYDRANNRLVIYVSRGGTQRAGRAAMRHSRPRPYGGQNWPAKHGLHHGRHGAARQSCRRRGREPLHRRRDRVGDAGRLP